MSLAMLIDQALDLTGSTLTTNDGPTILRLQDSIDAECHALAQLAPLSPDQERLFDDGVFAIKMLTEHSNTLQDHNHREALAMATSEAHQSRNSMNDRIKRIVQSVPSNGRTVTFMEERSSYDRGRGFRSLGEFAASIYDVAMGSMRPDPRLVPLQADMTMGSGPDGAWLLPPQFSSDVWLQMSQNRVNLIRMCDAYPITGESLTLPASAETSRATGSRFGGLRAYWTEEGTPITTSNPKVRRLKLEPHNLAALVPVDNSLVKNSLALDRYLNQALPEEIVTMCNIAILEGDGIAKPLGILKSGGRVIVAKDAPSQAPATITKTNVDTMWSRLAPNCRGNAVWLVHPDCDVQLEALTPPGTAGQTLMLQLPSDQGMPSLSLSPSTTLKGRPIWELDFCQPLGVEGDVILTDLLYYAVGIRGTLDVEMSQHLLFDRAQSVFRALFSIDGQPWLADPLQPYHGTNAISAYVTLATRA